MPDRVERFSGVPHLERNKQGSERLFAQLIIAVRTVPAIAKEQSEVVLSVVSACDESVKPLFEFRGHVKVGNTRGAFGCAERAVVHGVTDMNQFPGKVQVLKPECKSLVNSHSGQYESVQDRA